MAVVRLTGLYILYATLLLLNITCPTWQNVESQNSDVVLTVFRDTRSDTDRVHIRSAKPGAELDLRYITSKTMNCSRDEIYAQNSHMCTCKGSSPTYVVSERQCVNNVWLRRGCVFRFGSWRHSSGWTWSKEDNRLLFLYLNDGYGITGGFNASNREFERCTLANVTALTETGVWGKIDFDSKDVTFFVFRQHYHISWNTENLGAESRQEIQGRILKFSITCQPPEPTLHNDILRQPTESCLVFKVTGNFTVSPKRQESEKSKEDNTIIVAIALGVTFSILLLAGIVVGMVCYKRRSGTNITPRFISGFIAKIT